ncbi:hypothetical protein Tco_0903118 [Tanacetum coccineum]
MSSTLKSISAIPFWLCRHQQSRLDASMEVKSLRGICTLREILRNLWRLEKFQVKGVLPKHSAPNFWKNFHAYSNVRDLEMDDRDVQEDEVELLCKALEEISRERQYHEKCLSMLVNSLQLCQDNNTYMEGNLLDVGKVLFSKYRLIVSSVLVTTLPHQFIGT